MIHRINGKGNARTRCNSLFIHLQHLVACNFSAEMHHSMHIVIKCIDKIKINSVNNRLFRFFCHDKEEDFERLLLHIAVR